MIILNHYMINTNANHISYPIQIKEDMYQGLQDIICEAQKEEGIDFYDNTKFKLHLEEDYYIGRLSLRYNTNLVPLLITAGARTQDKHKYVWNEIMHIKNMLFPLEGEVMSPPSAPYIIDMVSPCLYCQPGIFQWNESLTKYVGWMLLFPETIT